MSRSLNRTEFIGNLTRDPEVKYTSNGSVVCTFSIAINRSFKKADGTIDKAVDYFDIEAWGKLAEICHQILKKGSYAYLDGELRNQTWTDQAGNNKSRTILRLNTMLDFTSSRRDGASTASSSTSTTSTNVAGSDEDLPIVEEIDESVDDMPF